MAVDDNKRNKTILFQFIMNYRAYRRGMIASRIVLTVLIAGAMSGLCAVIVSLGIACAAITLFFGCMSIIVSYNKEQTYTVYDTCIVIKSRGEKRKEIELSDVVAVKFKRAFYEKDLRTGTIKLTVKRANGIKRTYRLKHVFDAAKCVEYLNEFGMRN